MIARPAGNCRFRVIQHFIATRTDSLVYQWVHWPPFLAWLLVIFRTGTYFPNQSVVCHPTATYLGISMFASNATEKLVEFFTISNDDRNIADVSSCIVRLKNSKNSLLFLYFRQIILMSSIMLLTLKIAKNSQPVML
jgi:hypothetical protein